MWTEKCESAVESDAVLPPPSSLWQQPAVVPPPPPPPLPPAANPTVPVYVAGSTGVGPGNGYEIGRICASRCWLAVTGTATDSVAPVPVEQAGLPSTSVTTCPVSSVMQRSRSLSGLNAIAVVAVPLTVESIAKCPQIVSVGSPACGG